MNEIVNNSLSAGNKFMPEMHLSAGYKLMPKMHLRQPGFT